MIHGSKTQFSLRKKTKVFQLSLMNYLPTLFKLMCFIVWCIFASFFFGSLFCGSQEIDVGLMAEKGDFHDGVMCVSKGDWKRD